MFNKKYNTEYPEIIKIGGVAFSLIGHWNDLGGYYQCTTTGEIQSMDRLSGRIVYRGDNLTALKRMRGWMLDGTSFKEVV